MKVAKTLKSLGMVGVASLSLLAGTGHADDRNNPHYGGAGYYQPPPHPASFRAQVAIFEQRLDTQLQRIIDGMERGKLIMPEAVKLLREHLAIQIRERQFLNDGHLGPQELRELDQRLDDASRHIFLQASDPDMRGYGYRR